MPRLILWHVSMPTWLSPSLHFSFRRKKENKRHSVAHVKQPVLHFLQEKNISESQAMKMLSSPQSAIRTSQHCVAKELSYKS